MKVKLGGDHPNTLVMMNNLAWCLATAPDESLRDTARAVHYAAKAVEQAPQNECFRGTLGTARYSAGDWRGAIADLETAISLRKAEDAANAFEGFVLAMAHWQIGEKNKAQAWFVRAVEWMEKGDLGNPDLKRFRVQAAALLELDKRDHNACGMWVATTALFRAT
jgi:tetratricopeptide (TPR) repeat protein